MDKLRSLQYFVAAAEEKSLAGAARRFGVSTQAVAKLVSALERDLGVRLFDRASHGLNLTASGAAYRESCLPALSQLQLADELVRATPAQGAVVVGVQHVIAREVLTPALPHFHARHPQIQVDVRDFNRFSEEQTSGIDVFLALGWPRASDLVLRQIATSRTIVVASPAYWARHGMPRHPSELAHHTCLPIRSVDGTVMDLWTFARGDERVSVQARGWLTTSNAHRDMVIELARAGEGVAYILDWTNGDDLAAGTLVQALADWESPEAPPVNLLYRPSVRRVARVRLFIEYVIDTFQQLEAARGRATPPAQRPAWLKRFYGRASASMR
ncbi:MAG TPA: LysR family transcriptional regulator [Burkholderiaceae bacterium]|nr:LysR family transcriptional regulator [Burkholderiaceae bacterium]